ncbi:MAG: zinc ribbon domain-containing protein [Deltaproteobacteria bacterium]|nr:zinc ribbon domain-containing protein [Deltaproteobacteria bacterium]
MPIYEFHCIKCGAEFEEIVHSNDFSISCPACSATEVKKLMSAFSVKGSSKSAEGASSSGGCAACTSKNCTSCGQK